MFRFAISHFLHYTIFRPALTTSSLHHHHHHHLMLADSLADFRFFLLSGFCVKLKFQTAHDVSSLLRWLLPVNFFSSFRSFVRFFRSSNFFSYENQWICSYLLLSPRIRWYMSVTLVNLFMIKSLIPTTKQKTRFKSTRLHSHTEAIQTLSLLKLQRREKKALTWQYEPVFADKAKKKKKPTTRKLINKKFYEILVPKHEDNVGWRISRGCGWRKWRQSNIKRVK